MQQVADITGSNADSSLSLHLGSETQNVLRNRRESEQVQIAIALERMLSQFCRTANKIARLDPRRAERFSALVTNAVSEATKILG